MSSLCETCDKEVFFKCSWVMHYRAVPGWDAKLVRCKEGGHTYKVMECPKYKMEKTEKGRCRLCGRILQGERRKYRSDECASKAARMSYKWGKKEKKCVVCGEVMPFKKHKFCSEECKKLQAKLEAQKRRMEKWLQK